MTDEAKNQVYQILVEECAPGGSIPMTRVGEILREGADAAILANGHPLGILFASLLFGFMNIMGTTMGRMPGLNIPSSIIDLIEGIVMICVIISYFLRGYVHNRREKQRLRKAGAQK